MGGLARRGATGATGAVVVASMGGPGDLRGRPSRGGADLLDVESYTVRFAPSYSSYDLRAERGGLRTRGVSCSRSATVCYRSSLPTTRRTGC